jgi:hypothetical protein
MKSVQSQGEFNATVDRWVAAEIASGRATFASIVKQLPGVYPERVLYSLRRLKGEGRIAERVLADIESEVSRGPAPFISGFGVRLPLPHPVEYEWRFTEPTALHLLSLATQLCASGDRVTLLGTPSVAVTCRVSSDHSLLENGADRTG